MDPVRIGIVGAGFAAQFHARAYARIGRARVEVVAVASRSGGRAVELAARHGIPKASADYRDLLADRSIDAIDVCVPNDLHHQVVVEAARAGKHVLCEKPLTGYYGEGGDEPAGRTPKRRMLAVALRAADEMVAAAREAGVTLGYAENWLHAPPIQKARRLALASQGAILELRAEESHSGSHSPYAKAWRTSGGGSLVRLGSHPLAGVMHLKAEEGLARSGRPIRVKAVNAEVGDLSRAAAAAGEGRSRVGAGWQDVENWSTTILTFEDETRAIVFASDIVLGGMEDRLDLLLSNARVRCNLTHSNLCEAYAPDGGVFADEYLVEKLETKAGWSQPSVDEEWLLGYPQEIEDFVDALATGRPPLATGEFGRDVVEVMYAAYVAAEEGRRIALPVEAG